MTQLLEQAVDALRQLDAPNQDAMAAIILEQLANERHWDEAFARSQEPLFRLAEQVRQDISAGRIRSLGSDEQ
jgi:DnaJ-domain-containing protein 1